MNPPAPPLPGRRDAPRKGALVLAALVLLVLRLFATPGAWAAEPKVIDLRTAEGVAAVKGQWRYSNARIVEIPNKGPDGKPNTTYGIEPRAQAVDFDDSGWELVDPTTLQKGRSTGRVCFCWYRIKLTIPEEARGKRVFFQTTVDDYGEVWVNGKLPVKVGNTGGPVVAGFNAPNRLELAGA